jgi:hypothetical protein
MLEARRNVQASHKGCGHDWGEAGGAVETSIGSTMNATFIMRCADVLEDIGMEPDSDKWIVKVIAWVVLGFVLVAVLVFAIWQTPIGRDDSDGESFGSRRSGMYPHTDALTGCQYLSVYGGGITPRLDGDGRHVGCRPSRQ